MEPAGSKEPSTCLVGLLNALCAGGVGGLMGGVTAKAEQR